MRNRIAKRLIAGILASAMMLMLFAGCTSTKKLQFDVQDEHETTKKVKETPEASEISEDKDTSTASEEEWKAAYLEYVKEVTAKHYEENLDFYKGLMTYNDVCCYKLIYIDGDDIPELVISAGSDLLVSYHNGKLQKFSDDDYMNPITALYSGVSSYIGGEGKFIWQEKGNSSYNEIVCSLNSSGFSQDCAGTVAYWDFDYEHPDYYFWDEWDEYGNGTGDDIESYKCTDEADYKNKMGQYYDFSKETTDFGTQFSYDEIIAYLSPDGSNVDWKQAYKDTINESNYNAESNYWALIYLDSDDIPELVWGVDSLDCRYYTIHNGNAVELVSTQSIGGFGAKFILGEGLIYSCTPGSEKVYKLSDGNLSTIFDGSFSNEEQIDEDGNPYYPSFYYIGNQEVTPDQYSSTVDACFDQKKATSVIDPKLYNSAYNSSDIRGMNYTEIIKALSK